MGLFLLTFLNFKHMLLNGYIVPDPSYRYYLSKNPYFKMIQLILQIVLGLLRMKIRYADVTTWAEGLNETCLGAPSTLLHL